MHLWLETHLRLELQPVPAMSSPGYLVIVLVDSSPPCRSNIWRVIMMVGDGDSTVRNGETRTCLGLEARTRLEPSPFSSVVVVVVVVVCRWFGSRSTLSPCK
jgi:hypothetical protein